MRSWPLSRHLGHARHCLALCLPLADRPDRWPMRRHCPAKDETQSSRHTPAETMSLAIRLAASNTSREKISAATFWDRPDSTAGLLTCPHTINALLNDKLQKWRQEAFPFPLSASGPNLLGLSAPTRFFLSAALRYQLYP